MPSRPVPAPSVPTSPSAGPTRSPETPQEPTLALFEDRRALDMLRAFMHVEDDGTDIEAFLHKAQRTLRLFMLEYRFGLKEITTKVEILREQFDEVEDHSPIEHVKTRLKSIESLSEKIRRRGIGPDLDQVRENIQDIAGMRITCPYVSDVYLVAQSLRSQNDLTVLHTKDYIARPKPNGYRSLHLIVQVPVFLSDRTVPIPVEIQLRTIAMDFWASTEHELRYKFDGDVPQDLSEAMSAIAGTATALDDQMASLREDLRTQRSADPS
jgi:putative GTP pyrophosphokinase